MPKIGGDMERLNEKDIHCLARLLQGAIFEEDLLYGCRYCNYGKECNASFKRNHQMHFHVVRRNLGEITGLYFGTMYDPKSPQKEKLWLQQRI